MSLNKKHYEQLKEAFGDETYNEVFAPIKSKYASRFLTMYLEHAQEENALAKDEFYEIRAALNDLQVTDEG